MRLRDREARLLDVGNGIHYGLIVAAILICAVVVATCLKSDATMTVRSGNNRCKLLAELSEMGLGSFEHVVVDDPAPDVKLVPLRVVNFLANQIHHSGIFAGEILAEQIFFKKPIKLYECWTLGSDGHFGKLVSVGNLKQLVVWFTRQRFDMWVINRSNRFGIATVFESNPKFPAMRTISASSVSDRLKCDVGSLSGLQRLPAYLIGFDHLTELTGIDKSYDQANKYSYALDYVCRVVPPFRNATHAVLALLCFCFGIFFSGMFLFYSGIHTGTVRLLRCILSFLFALIFAFHGVMFMLRACTL